MKKMFSLPAEDEDLFIPQSSSNLAGLFGITPTVPPGNADLTYVAPKQPRNTPKSRSKEQPKAKPQNVVLFAKVTSVYKMDGDTRKILGKYGLALIGDSSGAKEIMIYKDKQNILSRITFTDDFQIHIKNEYVNLQDNNNGQWQVQFDDQKSLMEFLDELKKRDIKIVKEESTIDNTDSIDTKVDNEVVEQVAISQTRADILTRMAKMGQSILPNNLKSKSFDVDDAISSPPIVSRKQSEVDSNENLNPVNYQNPNENVRNNNVIQVNSPYQTPTSVSSQLTPFVPVYPSTERLPNAALLNTIISSQEFNLFATENRMQNSEMRMNLNSISGKLDNVLSEISKIREPNTDKLENEFLKSKVSDLDRTIGELRGKLELADNSSKCIELETVIREKDQQLRTEKEKIIGLENSLRNMEDVRREIELLRSKEKELNEEIHDLKGKLSNVENQLEQSDMKNSDLQKTYADLLGNNEDLHREMDSLKVNNSKMKLKDTEAIKGFSDIIKDSMNAMYQNIMTQFEESQQTQIKTVLSSNIKQTTFGVIQRFQQYLSDNPSDNEVQTIV